MTKADIVTQIYEKIGLSKREASEILEIVLSILKGALKEGETVKIAGFGNFSVRKKNARKGRNPKSGEEIEITPRKVVTFKPSIIFKGMVNR